jgi:hypothetical protein
MLVRRSTELDPQSEEWLGCSIECNMARVFGDVPNLPNSNTTASPTSAKISHHVLSYYTTMSTYRSQAATKLMSQKTL